MTLMWKELVNALPDRLGCWKVFLDRAELNHFPKSNKCFDSVFFKQETAWLFDANNLLEIDVKMKSKEIIALNIRLKH